MIDKNRRRRDVFRVERKSVRRAPKQLQNGGHVLSGGGGVETDETDRRPRTKHSDHDGFVIDRIHEHVTAVALMIKGIEFHFANASRELAGGRKRAGGERRNHGHVHYVHVAPLGNAIPAPLSNHCKTTPGYSQKSPNTTH